LNKQKEIRIVGLDSLIHISSNRIRTFSKGVTCVRCGIKGAFFAAEVHERDIKRLKGGVDPTEYRLHLNLYAIEEMTGKEVLMTSDHILPKSRGGGDGLDNRQPMCVKCNGIKGDKKEGEDYSPAEEANRQRSREIKEKIKKEMYGNMVGMIFNVKIPPRKKQKLLEEGEARLFKKEMKDGNRCSRIVWDEVTNPGPTPG
jgi:5-methylcytosine-specific restriction endonuclease McrA